MRALAGTASPSSYDVELAFWYALLCGASVSMQLLNKAIAVTFRETGVTSLDNLVMVFQQASAICLNILGVAAIGGEVFEIRPITRAQISRLALPSVNFVLMMVCSLKALKTVHVATVVVARNACTVFVCAGEALVFGKCASWTVIASLFVILAGAFAYGATDITFDATGYAWQTANSVLFVVGQLYEKWAMGKSSQDQTPMGVSTLKNAWSLPVLACLMIAHGDYRLSGVHLIPNRTWFLILLSGGSCCALSIAYMTLYKISSATAITVGGNFNKAVSIVIASYLFDAPFGRLQSLGLCVCFLGSLSYSLETARPSRKKASSP